MLMSWKEHHKFKNLKPTLGFQGRFCFWEIVELTSARMSGLTPLRTSFPTSFIKIHAQQMTDAVVAHGYSI